MKNFTVKKYNFLMFVALFIILLYSFNISFINVLFKNQYIPLFLIFISLVLIFIANCKYMKKGQINILLLFISFAAFLVAFRNGDILNKHFALPFYTLYALICLYLLSFTNAWNNIFLKLVGFFTKEHILGTIFCAIFRNFYLAKILPLFPEHRAELLYEYNHNQIAGITQHYSTNTIYLTIGFIQNLYLLIFDKRDNGTLKVKNVIWFILNSIALLLTGKRTQIVIVLLVIIFTIIILNRKNIINAFNKLIKFALLAISLIVIISLINPNITNSFVRIFESLSDSQTMVSRNILYDFAKEEFEQNPIIGIGWGNYKYEYNKKVINKEKEYINVHNMYLQLLCETGVLGFLYFVLLFLYLMINVCRDIIKHSTEENMLYLYIFFGMNIYFLLDGVLGNSLYDIQLFIPYSFFCAMFLFHHFNEKMQKLTTYKNQL